MSEPSTLRDHTHPGLNQELVERLRRSYPMLVQFAPTVAENFQIEQKRLFEQLKRCDERASSPNARKAAEARKRGRGLLLQADDLIARTLLELQHALDKRNPLAEVSAGAPRPVRVPKQQKKVKLTRGNKAQVPMHMATPEATTPEGA